MKKRNNILKFAGLILIGGSMAISCSTSEDAERVFPQDTKEITIETRSIPAGDVCRLYVFKKAPADTEYKLDRTVSIAAPGGTATVLLPEADLQSCAYRFLYVSQPASISNGVTVKNSSNTALAIGNLWSAVRIEAAAQNLSGNIYYLVQDIQGSVIKSTGSVSSKLIRLVGRQVIDIYKTNNGDWQDPVGTSTNVKSVLDRVKSVQLKYTGLTRSISFNASGQPVTLAQWAAYTMPVNNLTLIETLGTDFLKVEIPQAPAGIEQGSVAGSVRILGLWGLPATNTIRVNADFKYYNTLPLSSCPDPVGHNHTKTCFAENSLALDIPGPATLLSIKPNSYTVTKGGIRYDRIIDIGVSGGFRFETEWANGDV